MAATFRLNCGSTGANVAPVPDPFFLGGSDRTSFASTARRSGFFVALHFLDMPADERWERMNPRNAARGKAFSLHVSRWMFDFMERIWEPPMSGETAASNGQYVRR